MKKMRSLTAGLAVLVISVLATSCKKESAVPLPTTQVLKVSLFDEGNKGFIVPVGSTGISRGPRFSLLFETEGYVIHVKSITFEIVSNSKDPISAISFDNGSYWGGGSALSFTKSVKAKKVTFTGDFSVTPGVGGTAIEVGCSFAGIGANSTSGDDEAIRVSEVIYASEKDGLMGKLEPGLATKTNTIVYSVPYVSLLYSGPGVSTGNLQKGTVDFCVVQLSSSSTGSCKVNGLPLQINTSGVYFDPQKQITVKDENGNVVGTAYMPTITGGNFLLSLGNLSLVQRTRYLVLSAVVDSVDINHHTMTTTSGDWSKFSWVDLQTNTGLTLANDNKLIWFDNGYFDPSQMYVTIY